MARAMSTSVLRVLQTQQFASYFLVEFYAGSTAYRHTNCPYDLVIPSIGTFQAGKNLMTIELPKLSNSVDREAYKIVYADPFFEYRGIFDSGILGQSVKTYIVFICSVDEVGFPYAYGDVMVNDPIAIYSGRVDSVSFNINTEDEILATMECTSPMGALDLVKTYNTSKDCITQYDATDTAYDQIYQGSRRMQFLWGKK